jgi:hypothetical protein
MSHSDPRPSEPHVLDDPGGFGRSVVFRHLLAALCSAS